MATQLSDALVFIRHHQDGEIAEKLRNSGLNYNMTYGISSLLLANYAKEQGRNQQLANELWKENFREAKLLSLMFADYTTIDKTQIATYITGCTNNEMVEIGVTYLFSLLHDAFHYAVQWIDAENRYTKMAGYLTIARLAVKNDLGTVDELQPVFEAYEKDAMTDDFFILQALSKATQELSFRREDLKPLFIEKTKYLCKNNKNTKYELQLNELLQNLEYC